MAMVQCWLAIWVLAISLCCNTALPAGLGQGRLSPFKHAELIRHNLRTLRSLNQGLDQLEADQSGDGEVIDTTAHSAVPFLPSSEESGDVENSISDDYDNLKAQRQEKENKYRKDEAKAMATGVSLPRAERQDQDESSVSSNTEATEANADSQFSDLASDEKLLAVSGDALTAATDAVETPGATTQSAESVHASLQQESSDSETNENVSQTDKDGSGTSVEAVSEMNPMEERTEEAPVIDVSQTPAGTDTHNPTGEGNGEPTDVGDNNQHGVGLVEDEEYNQQSKGGDDQPTQGGDYDQPAEYIEPSQDSDDAQPSQDGNNDQPTQDGDYAEPSQDSAQPNQDSDYAQPTQDGDLDQPAEGDSVTEDNSDVNEDSQPGVFVHSDQDVVGASKESTEQASASSNSGEAYNSFMETLVRPTRLPPIVHPMLHNPSVLQGAILPRKSHTRRAVGHQFGPGRLNRYDAPGGFVGPPNFPPNNFLPSYPPSNYEQDNYPSNNYPSGGFQQTRYSSHNFETDSYQSREDQPDDYPYAIPEGKQASLDYEEQRQDDPSVSNFQQHMVLLKSMTNKQEKQSPKTSGFFSRGKASQRATTSQPPLARPTSEPKHGHFIDLLSSLRARIDAKKQEDSRKRSGSSNGLGGLGALSSKGNTGRSAAHGSVGLGSLGQLASKANSGPATQGSSVGLPGLGKFSKANPGQSATQGGFGLGGLGKLSKPGSAPQAGSAGLGGLGKLSSKTNKERSVTQEAQIQNTFQQLRNIG